jgi:tetratricopeptide (TPR) repeat protein
LGSVVLFGFLRQSALFDSAYNSHTEVDRTMKKTLAVSTLFLLVILAAQVSAAPLANSGEPPAVAPQEAAGGQQAAKGPQWKSRAEYDAFTAMTNEKDLHKKVSLAQDFVQKYADSDYKEAAYAAIIQSYAQLNDFPKMMDATQQALQAKPDSLDVITASSYFVPLLYKPDDPNKDAHLSAAETNAKKGLELLQKLQKPAGATDEQFNQNVKARRAILNEAVGFVGLQRNDFTGAVAPLKAAAEDTPSDTYANYRLGTAYLYSKPPDFDNAIWYLARADSLGQAAKGPDAANIDKFFTQVYSSRHGTDQGKNDVLAQAAGSPTPPSGFKVAPPEKPQPTGNKMLDAFNDMVFPLKLGGDTAQKAWDALKGQDIGLAGFVNSVEKGSDPGVFLVRISMDQAKASSAYDIELKDKSQEGVTDLKQGDPVRFAGKIGSYTATPTFTLVVDDGKINDDDLAAAAANKPKKTPAKPKPRRGAAG